MVFFSDGKVKLGARYSFLQSGWIFLFRSWDTCNNRPMHRKLLKPWRHDCIHRDQVSHWIRHEQGFLRMTMLLGVYLQIERVVFTKIWGNSILWNRALPSHSTKICARYGVLSCMLCTRTHACVSPTLAVFHLTCDCACVTHLHTSSCLVLIHVDSRCSRPRGTRVGSCLQIF